VVGIQEQLQSDRVSSDNGLRYRRVWRRRGNWATHGWWVLNPGDSKTVTWTTNQYVYFYAEAVNGASWYDPNGQAVYVTQERFDSCYLIGVSDWQVVRMAQSDVGWPPAAPFTHTVNLNS
jgi:hypothetical protein